ncbi:polar amino acid ABC transporter, inner membrane subunit [Paenibacillus larvae subsp. larvae]|uniref:Polar amino acid ABC transporter, inner membrane subunit n=1 Tax=Paenibacillus larvae subsp. larvae TaxID=147375 RepID=A0A2L1U029_9BACL|nr:amino acid ABC transporter permease [Paenibacillus larvae]AQT86621.1 ABC transporter permease [Paenibacillus larvae subsp. pulvifaciens]AQZ48309.1 ABC transporter permease [Paenibacillus larvae subsp. pulvifaciens]AVF26290.1 polar amino acid ABC transporter, inner membrane subunit [Paenibacillus larvae subsp. larvae]AVF31067.1 polar amino acid ABC transporter, inner membrane subunit [Paenibacillus larvae subsp. larvae]MBH0343677.1 ABC transporter permease [Paenibacillus larvae]
MSLVLENIPFLLKGAYYTLLITIVSMFFGLIIGVVVAVARIKGNRPIQWLARAYVSIIRGTPALVQIFIVYYGLVDYGIALSSLTAAFVALSINVGAYLSETFRGAILSIPKGQTEAAYAAGMTSWQAMRRIILPQAARVAIPPMGNTFIGMLKETSLVSSIAVTELLRSAQLMIAQYYVNMPFYIGIAVMYWVMSTVFSFILGAIEKRLAKAY